VLDEPTNDLDIETLELLEELLSNYQGTLLLVSHDRTFLDNIVTSSLVFEGDGKITEYIGGYNDWHRQTALKNKIKIEKDKTKTEASTKIRTIPRNKLNYKESRELENLPAKIEQLEMQKNELEKKIASPLFYKQSSDVIVVELEKFKKLEEQIKASYKRWEELEIRTF